MSISVSVSVSSHVGRRVVTRCEGMAGIGCGVALRLVVFRLPLCKIPSLLEGIVVLLLLDGISDGLQGRLGRRHGRRCEEGAGLTSRSDSASE